MQLLPLRLSPGHDLRREIETAALGLPGGSAFVLSGIGSLTTAAVRFAAAEHPLLLNEPLEVVSLSGTVARGEAHLHGVVSTSAGQVLGGHLGYGCIVRTTAEVLLAGVPGWKLSREADAATGYRELGIAPDA